MKECGREHETHARSVHRFEVLDFASGRNRAAQRPRRPPNDGDFLTLTVSVVWAIVHLWAGFFDAILAR